MDAVCSVPLLQQLSLKTSSPRAEAPSYSDCSDGEQHTVKARRYSGVFSPSKRASSQAAEAPEAAASPAWTAGDSAALYNIPGWGAEYFQAAPDGHLLVAPQGGESASASAPPHARGACFRPAAPGR